MIGEVAESLLSSMVMLEPRAASWRGVGAILACGGSGGGGGGGRRREERLGAVGRDSLPPWEPAEGTSWAGWGEGLGGIWPGWLFGWAWLGVSRVCVCLCVCVEARLW